MTHLSSAVPVWLHIRSTAGLALVLIGVAGACSSGDPGRGPIGSGPNESPSSVPPPMPSTAPPITDVALSWRDYGNLLGQVRSASDELVVDLTNNTAEEQSGSLFLVASGLNGQLVRHPLETFQIAGHATREVRVPVASLPIQSEVSTAFATVEAEIARPSGDRILVPTSTLYYAFGEGYREAAFYDDNGAFTIDDGAAKGNSPLASKVGHDLFNVQGRILQNDGTWLDVSTPPAASGRSTFRQGLSRARLVRREDLLPRQGEVAAEESADNGDGTLPIFASVCATWRVMYLDSVGRGEDLMVAQGMHDEPASHTYVEITNADTGSMVWQGHLNSGGCIGRSWGEGNYILTQFGDVASNSRQFISYQANPIPGGEDIMMMPVIETAFTIDDFEGPYVVATTGNNDAIQAIAVAGKVLIAQNTLNGLGMPVGSYTIHGNEDCNPVEDPVTRVLGACCKLRATIDGPGAPDRDECVRVVTGRTPNGSNTRNASWKFIIAHEIGHHVMNRAMRYPGRSYIDSASLPAVCACRFMTPAWGDDIILNGNLDARPNHCLQGREQTGAAQMEGFAHAFASRVFNRTNQANGTFVYYKQYNALDHVVNPPTHAINLFTNMTWEYVYCPVVGEGVEWDWMVFFYKIATESASNSIAFSDVFSIYKRACGNPSAPCDENDPVGYEQLRAAAQAHFGGTGNARYQKFNTTATQTRVHD